MKYKTEGDTYAGHPPGLVLLHLWFPQLSDWTFYSCSDCLRAAA